MWCRQQDASIMAIAQPDREPAIDYRLHCNLDIEKATIDLRMLFGATVRLIHRPPARIPMHDAFLSMSRYMSPFLPLLVAGALSTLSAQAIPPPPESFDGETIRCQASGSAATVLICRDAELKALDGQLRKAFRRLRDDTSLKESEREALVGDQRRWVDTMDQCWRARESLRACVKTSQQQRLRQLESMIQRRLMPVSKDEGKGCEG
jgi:uncharacterized protein YecT (DUF1311 family)